MHHGLTGAFAYGLNEPVVVVVGVDVVVVGVVGVLYGLKPPVCALTCPASPSTSIPNIEAVVSTLRKETSEGQSVASTIIKGCAEKFPCVCSSSTDWAQISYLQRRLKFFEGESEGMAGSP